ncbi:MAG: alpha/beta hydrolase, partial [Abditibacteriaceae bacterium]
MRIQISPETSISYQLTGTGQTIVFLHPFPMDHRLWENQVAHFSTQYQILTPDLRGFGNSDGFEGQPPSIE